MCLQLPRSAVGRASARMAFDAALRQLWAMMSPSPGLQLKVADSGASGGRPKCPETALRCPTLGPGARKRGLHRPRRTSAPFMGTFSRSPRPPAAARASSSSRGAARRNLTNHIGLGKNYERLRAAALFKIAASMAFDVEMCPASSSVDSRSKTPLPKTHALGSPMYGLTNSG